MRTGWNIVAVVAVFAAAAAILSFGVTGPPKPGSSTQLRPIWVETKWPFPMDQWGEGRAFSCKAADCGHAVRLYVRTKVGFCSSTTGVADDNELERLSDFDFMPGAVARGSSHEIAVAWMKGRLRNYAVAGTKFTATSAAYNNDSDAVVATIIADGSEPAAEPTVIAFLDGDPVLGWVRKTLGLE
jgi:hypothetical protein